MTTRDDPTVTADELERAAAYRTELRRFLRRTKAAAADAGLTAERYDLLLMIKTSPHGDEQSTVTELCERLQLQQTAVTELVRRAEEAGLVERTRSSDDRRVSLLRLTDDGERRLLDAFVALRRDREALAAAFARVNLRFRAVAVRR